MILEFTEKWSPLVTTAADSLTLEHAFMVGSALDDDPDVLPGDIDIWCVLHEVTAERRDEIHRLTRTVRIDGHALDIDDRAGPIDHPRGSGTPPVIHLLLHDPRTLSVLSPATLLIIALTNRPIFGPPVTLDMAMEMVEPAEFGPMLALDMEIFRLGLTENRLAYRHWVFEPEIDYPIAWIPIESERQRNKLRRQVAARLRAWHAVIGLCGASALAAILDGTLLNGATLADRGLDEALEAVTAVQDRLDNLTPEQERTLVEDATKNRHSDREPFP